MTYRLVCVTNGLVLHCPTILVVTPQRIKFKIPTSRYALTLYKNIRWTDEYSRTQMTNICTILLEDWIRLFYQSVYTKIDSKNNEKYLEVNAFCVLQLIERCTVVRRDLTESAVACQYRYSEWSVLSNFPIRVIRANYENIRFFVAVLYAVFV